ncbi:MAG TPA: DUF504 domain-containing protein [Rhodocyclaceae bacterium]|nr:DUF504 domain-containing protein [Rhodocyclaceae bacterium]
MQPIHQLLARIRWDPEFSRSQFDIGYWDRGAREVVRVRLSEIAWDSGNPSFFDVVDGDGIEHSIPFHRVRKVWRNGVLIWNRDRSFPQP